MKRLGGDTALAATSEEVNDLSRKSRSTRAEPLVCVGWPTQAARKSPASESVGSSGVDRFSPNGLPPGGASVTGKMTWALALAGPPSQPSHWFRCRAADPRT